MTSSSDIMVANQKTANHKLANRHVTIGDSTYVVMTPDLTPETPDTEGVHSFQYTAAASSGAEDPSLDHEAQGQAPERWAPKVHVSSTPITPPANQRARPISEEYYDVLHPDPKDQSLESRDNPFLPGGELSREAEDLLSRATIIRDNFYLNEEEKRTLREQQQQELIQQQQQQEQQQQPQKQQRGTKHVQIRDHHDGSIHSSRGDYSPGSSPPPGSEAVEERISPAARANAVEAAPPATNGGGDGHSAQPRENGKVGDATATASPDSVKLAIPDGEGQSLPAGQTGAGGPPGGGELQVQDSEKKRRNKCCSIM